MPLAAPPPLALRLDGAPLETSGLPSVASSTRDTSSETVLSDTSGDSAMSGFETMRSMQAAHANGTLRRKTRPECNGHLAASTAADPSTSSPCSADVDIHKVLCSVDVDIHKALGGDRGKLHKELPAEAAQSQQNGFVTYKTETADPAAGAEVRGHESEKREAGRAAEERDEQTEAPEAPGHSKANTDTQADTQAAPTSEPDVGEAALVPSHGHRHRHLSDPWGQEMEQASAASSAPSLAVATAALDEVLVGTRIQEGHESFVTAYNMLTGIRVAVSRCNAKVNRPLVSSDFTETKEFSFDLSGGGLTPSAKYIFRFKDYSPWVFRHLRDLFKLDPADYLMSLTAKYIVSELGSPGKSGSFFYYSRDYRFIIKTIRHSEHKRLREILKDYYRHVQKYPNTLLSQFYGLHRVKLPFGRKIHFVVMNNVFPAVYEMHRKYDLKGSTLGRTQPNDPNRPYVVHKDLDWLRDQQRIVLGPEKRKQLLRQLELDVGLLKRMNVMDYSLLIGIHEMSKGNAALDALVSLKEFGPSRGTDPAAQTHAENYGNVSKRENQEFAKLQKLLQTTNPTALKNFDFSDDYRKEFLFYRDRGGFQSTDDANAALDVIYYMGVIDFLTGYTLRKRVETFCKSIVHKKSELSAIPAAEYGERFYRFMCLSVGSAIKGRKRRASQRVGENEDRPDQFADAPSSLPDVLSVAAD